MSYRHFKPRKKPFLLLSRGKRRDQVLKVKQRINAENELNEGIFTTSHRCIWDDDVQPIHLNYLDFLFIGSNRFTYWNARITPASYAFMQSIEQRSFEKALSLTTSKHVDDLSFTKLHDQVIQYLIEQDPPTIFETYKINPYFANGIGLEMIVDTPRITRQVIKESIQHFFSLGEKDWQSKTSIPRERLMPTSFSEYLIHQKRSKH